MAEPQHELDARIAARAASMRLSIGLTQVDMAQLMARHGYRWHDTTVAKVEHHVRRVSGGELVALADVLGVSVDYLAGTLDSEAGRRRAATWLAGAEFDNRGMVQR